MSRGAEWDWPRARHERTQHATGSYPRSLSALSPLAYTFCEADNNNSQRWPTARSFFTTFFSRDRPIATVVYRLFWILRGINRGRRGSSSPSAIEPVGEPLSFGALLP
ncbi:hypothetical protein [Pandoravirus japonicus]|uniref:Uncharacterized protein n=1 Tax=Pandoravirus japonicus TaxID=2823154 RepID=A0A811BS97_9VIRU|nr:hypothetical protein [Pandoravirus japonicus]